MSHSTSRRHGENTLDLLQAVKQNGVGGNRTSVVNSWIIQGKNQEYRKVQREFQHKINKTPNIILIMAR